MLTKTKTLFDQKYTKFSHFVKLHFILTFDIQYLLISEKVIHPCDDKPEYSTSLFQFSVSNKLSEIFLIVKVMLRKHVLDFFVYFTFDQLNAQ